MICRDCKYWNCSNKVREYVSWADCYRVIGSLAPDLLDCVGDSGVNFSLPFDPHDANKFKCYSRFRDLYHRVRSSLPKGVRVKKINGKFYFQTREDFLCPKT